MNSGSNFWLRCLLSVALLAGSLTAWTADPAHGVDAGTSQMTQVAPQDDEPGDCHDSVASADDPDDIDHDRESCCEHPEGCDHDNCDCACPALSLVVPTRLPASAQIATPVALANLSPDAPRNTTDTPLRPPQS